MIAGRWSHETLRVIGAGRRGDRGAVRELLRRVGKVQFEGPRQALHWETDDVGQGAFDAVDQVPFVVLRCIRARFVEGIDAPEIDVNMCGIEITKFHLGEIAEGAFTIRGSVEQAHGGNDLMDAASESEEHRARLFEISRFAEDFAVEYDDRVGSEDKPVGVEFRASEGFSPGVHLGQGSWGLLGPCEFFDIGRHGHERVAGRFEQFLPPGRAACENQLGQWNSVSRVCARLVMPTPDRLELTPRVSRGARPIEDGTEQADQDRGRGGSSEREEGDRSALTNRAGHCVCNEETRSEADGGLRQCNNSRYGEVL